jgi:hypothetical protein
MNRRDFMASLGAAIAAGVIPSAVVEQIPAMIGPQADALSVAFHYEDGTKVGPFPAAFTANNMLTLTSVVERSGTIVGASLYMGGEYMCRSNLVDKQVVMRGDSATLSWFAPTPKHVIAG